MREQTFQTSADIALNVASSRSTGPPIVLLHGVTRRWQDWLSVVPHLSPRWQVFVPDLRGHGRSARTRGAYRVADYVPDIVDFLRIELDAPAILIGHSLGGNVAAAVAADAPERVRGVVLEDPVLGMAGPRIVETSFPALFRAFLPYAGSDCPIAAIAADLAEARVPLPGGAGMVRLGEVRDPISLRVSASGLKRLDPEVLGPPLVGRWDDGHEIEDVLRGVTCPTLMIQADPAAGGALPDDHAAEMAALIRDCVRHKLAGVGHNIHAAATEAMMRLVVPFLGSLE